MIKFKSLELENIRVYKKAKVSLESQGIVSILGKNGAGKSTLWSVLEAMLYGTTPSGHKKNDLVKNKKDSKIELEFDRGEDNYRVGYNRVDGKWVHIILKNGKDITPHSEIEAAKATKLVLGISQTEFAGAVHLSQNSQHILIDGKPADRKNYISAFFGLDDRYDLVMNAAKEELSKVKSEIAKTEGYSSNKQMLESQLDDYPYADPDVHDEEYNSLHAQGAEIAASLQDLTTEQSLAERYYANIEKASEVENPGAVKSILLLEKLTLEKQLADAAQISAENSKRSALNNQRKQHQETIDVCLSYYDDVGSLSATDLESQKQALIDKKNRYESNRDRITAHLQNKEVLGNYEPTDASPYDNAINELEAENKFLRNKIKNCKNGLCPTCGHELAEVELGQDEACLKANEAELVELKKNRESVVYYNSLHTTVAGSAWLEEVDDFNEEDKASLDKTLHKIGTLTSYDKSLQFLKSFPQAEYLEEPDEIEVGWRLQEIEKQVETLDQVIGAKNRLPDEKPKRTVDNIKSQIIDLRADKIAIEDRLQGIMAAREKIKAVNLHREKILKELEKINTFLTSLPDLKKKELLFSKLVDAYGPRGLRIKQLEKIMDLVLSKLPFYTGLLFDDKSIRFEHKCDSTSIQILMVRSEVEGSKTVDYSHDISSLSGGEKKRLSIALILTLAKCIPMHKRSNMLILDEVDTNLDSYGQYQFVNELLPLLKKEYESIFIISHAEEIQQASVFDKTWKIKKENSWSVLESH